MKSKKISIVKNSMLRVLLERSSLNQTAVLYVNSNGGSETLLGKHRETRVKIGRVPESKSCNYALKMYLNISQIQ